MRLEFYPDSSVAVFKAMQKMKVWSLTFIRQDMEIKVHQYDDLL